MRSSHTDSLAGSERLADSSGLRFVICVIVRSNLDRNSALLILHCNSKLKHRNFHSKWTLNDRLIWVSVLSARKSRRVGGRSGCKPVAHIHDEEFTENKLWILRIFRRLLITDCRRKIQWRTSSNFRKDTWHSVSSGLLSQRPAFCRDETVRLK